MVDPVNKISAVLMMQIIDADRVLKQDFYNNIFKNLEKILKLSSTSIGIIFAILAYFSFSLLIHYKKLQ